MRISYRVVKQGTYGTVFGKLLEKAKIIAYSDESGNYLYDFFAGSRDDAIAALRAEDASVTWFLRFVGFLFMFYGIIVVYTSLKAVFHFSTSSI